MLLSMKVNIIKLKGCFTPLKMRLELKRLKIANLALDENLKSGEYKLLSDKELKLLQH